MGWKSAGVGAVLVGGGAWAKNKIMSTQRRTFARYWEQSNIATMGALSRSGPEPLVMVALGDSCAQGLGASAPQRGYVPRTAAAVATMSGRPVALINLSVSGAVISSVIASQIPALYGLGGAGVRPDIVTLDIGSNDVAGTMDISEIATLANLMFSKLPAGVFAANIPSFGPGSMSDRSRAVSAIIAEAAAGHHIIDLETYTSSMNVATYMLRYHGPDMFHPNARAYQAWAQLWSDSIAAELGYPTVDVTEVGPYVPLYDRPEPAKTGQ